MNTTVLFRQRGDKRGPAAVTAMLVMLVLPFLATVYALYDAALHGVQLFFPLLALVLYIFTGIGITVGYHRLFTHQSFTASPLVQRILGIGGLMALQGSIRDWCSQHHTHHVHSDRPGEDPHTPYEYGYSWLGLWIGFWHAHFGWLLKVQAPEKNATYLRLCDDPIVSSLDRHALFWVVMSFALPTVAGFAYTQTLDGAWLGLLWGGGVRVFVLHHVTWAVNSVCHVWGTQPFKTKDWSRDNIVVGLLGFGEGFHNGHHAFMRSPCHSIDRPWLDVSYWVIRLIGMEYQKNVPSPDLVQRLRAG